MKSLFSEEELKIVRGLEHNVVSSKSRLLRKHKIYIENNKNEIDSFCKFPRILLIETIASCNAKCIMCPTPWVKRKRKKVLDDKLYEKIIDDCKDLKPKMIWLHLNGEPFLDPRIFDRLDYIDQTIPDMKIGLFTNASLLDEEKIRHFYDYNIEMIHVSVNAARADTYEKIMGLDYERLRNNMELILKHNKNAAIEVSFVIVDENRKEIDEFREIWEDSVDKIAVYGCGSWVGDYRLNIDRFMRLKNRMKTLLRPPIPCVWRLINMFILSDGKVVHCCSDFDGKVVIGDANDESLLQIWSSDLNKELRYKHLYGTHKKEISICRNCEDSY